MTTTATATREWVVTGVRGGRYRVEAPSAMHAADEVVGSFHDAWPKRVREWDRADDGECWEVIRMDSPAGHCWVRPA